MHRFVSRALPPCAAALVLVVAATGQGKFALTIDGY